MCVPHTNTPSEREKRHYARLRQQYEKQLNTKVLIVEWLFVAAIMIACFTLGAML